ncbi:fimbrial protein [Pantoea agglomerans]|uniref:fimbrial protein n=1 Tax=Enterobacter agglomerans TaxID=549 RepID=UPI003C7D2BD2
MKFINQIYLFLCKTLLAGAVLWLLSFNASAYDFEVTCSGTNGVCGPGINFTMTKISSAHDGTAMPYRPTNLQIYLANCTSDTSCTKLVGPFYERITSYPAWEAMNWGTWGGKFLTSGNSLSGTITSGINAGSGDVWNPNAYKNLCFSITGVNSSSGWLIWGINYTYPVGQVMCSAPINRIAADTCSATTPSIDVAFGELERSKIPTQPGGEYDKTKSFTLSCTGSSAHNFSLKLNMVPVSWSSSQMTTSNTALGVSMSKDSVTISNGSSFTMNVPAGGSNIANLVFSVLKNPSLQASKIATGDFTASATLVVTEI